VTPRGLALAALLAAPAGPAAADELAWVRAYDEVWTSPSRRALDSMPVGGGRIALNVWSTGEELLLYVGSPDSWIEADPPQQVKLGRVRVRLRPNTLAREFRQRLDLATNSAEVSGRAEDGTSATLRVWVDALRPVVHIEGSAARPVHATVAVETWRGEGRFVGARALFRVRNEGPSGHRRRALAKQGIEGLAPLVPDPVANLTFGGSLSGAGFEPAGEGRGTHEGQPFRSWTLHTASPTRKLDVRVVLRVEADATVEAWETAVERLEEQTRRSAGRDRAATELFWREFWNRSRIVVNPGATAGDPAWQVGRRYQLFRAMLAANRTGRMPTLFNGGAFLCEPDPDKRHWGFAGFMAQNQRLVYWPLLKSGDGDVLRVALEFYRSRHALALAWARHFWGVEGGVFTEDVDLFGLPAYSSQGGHSTPDALRYHYTSGLEFALMMLQAGEYSGADVRPYVPVATGMLRFFDGFYRNQARGRTRSDLDSAGRLVLEPVNGLEVYTGARNDAATLAGLRALGEALLALPGGALGAADREFTRGFLARLPPLPTREWRGHRCLAPAEAWAAERLDFNMELPQLYPVFPFRLYGVGRPDAELARDTWRHGYTDEARQKPHFCWYQGGIFTACLGLVDEAREYALARFLHPAWPAPGVVDGKPDRRGLSPWKLHWLETPGWTPPRYPAFWDAMDFDARPDMDHGGAGMIQLQEMLLQTVGRRILLLPAWPREWDVDFRLHAPGPAVVEASVRRGRVTRLRVTPESRRRDVQVVPPGASPRALAAR
jgi:hypothetical protein